MGIRANTESYASFLTHHYGLISVNQRTSTLRVPSSRFNALRGVRVERTKTHLKRKNRQVLFKSPPTPLGIDGRLDDNRTIGITHATDLNHSTN